ncbi:hypothetical protein ACFC1R_36385, partial [Kitasatospora sp. NPDC056138]|uniref:hypothetical protein n=1 Tax=Kitasatospora sp. NPDC056138 TaxID=3345724 RepID=UPI0035D6C0C8
GRVYTEPCSSPANWYEQWYEDWDGSHFRLKNRQTQAYLDSNKEGDVYVMYGNGGKNQAWS